MFFLFKQGLYKSDNVHLGSSEVKLIIRWSMCTSTCLPDFWDCADLSKENLHDNVIVTVPATRRQTS